jgi:ABC-2 type transport system permease protein
MHDALLIAKREYLERVRSKTFVFTTIVISLLMAGLTGGSIFALRHGAERDRTLVVAGNDPGLADGVKEQLEGDKDTHFLVDVIAPVGAEAHEELTREVNAGDYDGLLWIETKPGNPRPVATYESRSSTGFLTGSLLQDAITRVVARRQLAEAGIAPERVRQLLEPVQVQTLQVKNGRPSGSDGVNSLAATYAMILLLYFSVIYYGMNVARSVIQEKTSRIFEVLLAATTPESLMAGKLIGVGAAGLTQIAIWLGLTLTLGGVPLAAHLRKGALAALGLSATQIVFFAFFFVVGFLFYSALSAAFGASVSSEQEVQQFSFLIVLPMIVGIVLMTYILNHPNAPAVVALSLFPPCTPVVMYLRMASQMPPLWQLALSIVLMVAATWAMLWIASRIYRVGILMYGKRPALAEVVRWLRQS